MCRGDRRVELAPLVVGVGGSFLDDGILMAELKYLSNRNAG
jgi:hypothetical protein